MTHKVESRIKDEAGFSLEQQSEQWHLSLNGEKEARALKAEHDHSFGHGGKGHVQGLVVLREDTIQENWKQIFRIFRTVVLGALQTATTVNEKLAYRMLWGSKTQS